MRFIELSFLFVLLIALFHIVPGNTETVSSTIATDQQQSKENLSDAAAAGSIKPELPSSPSIPSSSTTKEVLNNTNESQNKGKNDGATTVPSTNDSSIIPTRDTTSRTASTSKPLLIHSSQPSTSAAAAAGANDTDKNTNGNSITPASTTQEGNDNDGKDAGTMLQQSTLVLFGVVILGGIFL